MPIVRLYGNLRRHAGASEFKLPGRSVGALLEAACADQPALREALFAGTALRAHVRVMVNGQDVELAQGLETAVAEADVIAVFPPIAGGAGK